MTFIKDIIPHVIEGLVNSKAAKALDWESLWSGLDEATKGSRVSDFKEGQLTVVVDSAARGVKLNLQKQQFIKALKLKGVEVQQIYFKVGKV